MGARREERREVALGIAERIGMDDAGDIEAVRAGDVGNDGLEAVGIVQKSRSA